MNMPVIVFPNPEKVQIPIIPLNFCLQVFYLENDVIFLEMQKEFQVCSFLFSFEDCCQKLGKGKIKHFTVMMACSNICITIYSAVWIRGRHNAERDRWVVYKVPGSS